VPVVVFHEKKRDMVKAKVVYTSSN
jgi:hypothetical protein